MTSRLAQIASHLTIQSTSATVGPVSSVLTRIGVKSPDDVVIVDAVRTPMTRSKKGGFKDTVPEDLLAAVLTAIKVRTKIDPSIVDDICVGTVLQASGGATVSRMAALYSGYPEKTSVYTTNRQCSSGLQAVVNIAAHIQAGLIDIGIGAGVESMTLGYGPQSRAERTSEKIPEASKAAQDCKLPMGITSENVAKDFGIDRKRQDAFSALSFQKAAKAQKEGKFDSEIIPVETTIIDPKTDTIQKIIVSKDDGVRDGVTEESLSKLKPAFGGLTTAGSASQVSDGAAAVLLMKRKTAHRLGLPILAKYVASAAVGCPPRIMGVGPLYAIPAACKKAGIEIKDVDVFELNEAFASQAVYVIEELGLDINKVNPSGGAIALGHPLGCTGARQISTILPELKRQNKKIGLTTMCIGSGMGMAAIWERE